MNDILTATKELLGIPEDVSEFDSQLVMYINMTFMILNQLGVGPTEPYIVTLTSGSLEEFISDEGCHGLLQMYIYTKVRVLFDPPTTSFVLKALESTLEEYEWRLTDYSSTAV